MKPTMKSLRADLPTFAWSAKRAGLGWFYVGTRGEGTVTLRAYGVLCGPADDDYETRWMVEDTGESYVSFWTRENVL